MAVTVSDTDRHVNTLAYLDTEWYCAAMEPIEHRRLTRDEQRAQTRARLLEAAATVFNRLGYAGASLEAVAEAAGYTKGAVYSNFASKAELFVALARQHSLETGGPEVAEQLRSMPVEAFVDSLGGLVRSQAARDRAWDVLTIEFWLAAMRDPALRPVVDQAYEQMRCEYGPIIHERLVERGIAPAFTGRELGALVSAIGSGLLMQYYLDPDAVDPDLLPRALRVLLGLPATEGAAGAPEAAAGQGSRSAGQGPGAGAAAPLSPSAPARP